MSTQTFSNPVYMPPEAKIVPLSNFDLTKIEETFVYAKFERRISKTKTHKIAQAIMDNKFTDNVIRVVNHSGAEKYEVLDGQHRLEGLRYARDSFGLQNYDLILMVYNGANKREIYRRLNLGKPLTLGDHLKAMDTGSNRFFNSLRDQCAHYASAGTMRYATILNCLHYAKSTSIRPVRPITVDDFVASITTRDIGVVKRFIPLLEQVATNPDSLFWHYTMMRNLFRVFFENSISQDKFLALADVLKKSAKVKELAEKRDTFAMRGIYHYIIDIAAPKAGLQLSKGDIKN